MDPDAGNFGKSRFSLISTNSKSLFALNPKTGAISVASSLMSYADRAFSLVIGARDNAGGMISNVAKRNATVIFKIEPASVDVVCVSLISAAVMELKAPAFKRYILQ